jgi:hypothetical protein
VRLEDDGVALLHNRTLSTDETTLTLELSAEPVLPANAVATVSTAVTDRAGNALVADATHAVVFPAWVVVVPPSALPAALPHLNEIEIDSTGAVWVLAANTSLTQWALLRWDAGVLGASIPIGPAGTIRSVHLRLDSMDRPVVCYTTPAVHIDVLLSDGTWSPHPVLDVTFSSDVELELDPADVPHLLRRFDSSTYEILKLIGGTWTRIADTISTTSVGLDLAVDATRVYVTRVTSGGVSLGILDASGAWSFTTACTESSGVSGCAGVQYVTYGTGGVRAFIGSWTGSVSGRSYTSTIRAAPSWAVELMVPGAGFSAAGGTPTGFIAVHNATTARVLRDETGRTWALPASYPEDVDAHGGRPFIVGGTGLLSVNSF